MLIKNLHYGRKFSKIINKLKRGSSCLVAKP